MFFVKAPCEPMKRSPSRWGRYAGVMGGGLCMTAAGRVPSRPSFWSDSYRTRQESDGPSPPVVTGLTRMCPALILLGTHLFPTPRCFCISRRRPRSGREKRIERSRPLCTMALCRARRPRLVRRSRARLGVIGRACWRLRWNVTKRKRQSALLAVLMAASVLSWPMTLARARLSRVSRSLQSSGRVLRHHWSVRHDRDCGRGGVSLPEWAYGSGELLVWPGSSGVCSWEGPPSACRRSCITRTELRRKGSCLAWALCFWEYCGQAIGYARWSFAGPHRRRYQETFGRRRNRTCWKGDQTRKRSGGDHVGSGRDGDVSGAHLVESFVRPGVKPPGAYPARA